MTIVHEQLELHFGKELESLQDQTRRMLKSLLYNGSATKGQQWFSKAGRARAVNNEGGWDMMIVNALLRVIEEGDFSKGLRQYCNYLATEYGDTRERTTEWWNMVIPLSVRGTGENPLLVAQTEEALERETSSPSPDISLEVFDDQIVVRQDSADATTMRALAAAFGAALAAGHAASLSSKHIVHEVGTMPTISDLLVSDEEREIFESYISTRNLAESARLLGITPERAEAVVQRVRRRAERLATAA